MRNVNTAEKGNKVKFYIIRNWCGKWLSFENIDRFDSWDDAEEFLSLRLGDNYETYRGEYYIEELTDNTKRSKNYLDPFDPRG